VITLYETNSDILIVARGAQVWSLGAPYATADYLDGTFAEDAQAWVNEDCAQIVHDPLTDAG
jgi:hypothetical protein